MIASTIAICGNGIPTHAAIATDPSNPVIFPYAEKRKRMARRSRAKKFVYGIYSKKEIKVSPSYRIFLRNIVIFSCII